MLGGRLPNMPQDFIQFEGPWNSMKLCSIQPDIYHKLTPAILLMRLPIPCHPCMAYLPTFGWFLWWIHGCDGYWICVYFVTFIVIFFIVSGISHTFCTSQGAVSHANKVKKIDLCWTILQGDSKWPFYPLFGGHQHTNNPLKRSLNHPKKVTMNHQVVVFCHQLFFTISPFCHIFHPWIQWSHFWWISPTAIRGGKLDGETEDEFQRRNSGGPQVEGIRGIHGNGIGESNKLTAIGSYPIGSMYGTLPETNMAPENRPSQKERKVVFLAPLVSGRVPRFGWFLW